VVLSVRSDFSPAERGLAPTELELLWAIPPDYPARLRASLTREKFQLRSDDF
jgi:hypothetical protein